jgi:hypothetical protein
MISNHACSATPAPLHKKQCKIKNVQLRNETDAIIGGPSFLIFYRRNNLQRE